MSTEHQDTVKGASLARGPAWIIGSVLAAFGLLFFFKAAGTPLSTSGFPQGNLNGRHFLGFEVNAWTAWLTAAAGVLVLIGCQQHAIAKATSLVVGVALAVAAGMALIASDVLGLAAANWVDAIGWGVAAALLIVTALLPRLSHDEPNPRPDAQARADEARNQRRDQQPAFADPRTGGEGAPNGAANEHTAPAGSIRSR